MSTTTRRQAEAIIERMDAETQDIIRHTRIDLAAFKALSQESKAARWRQLDQTAKEDLVIQELRAHGIEWTPELVACHIGKLNTRWGTTPTPTETAVIGALAEQAQAHADHARTARRAHEPADATHFQRSATAYTNALVAYRSGVRPERLPDGSYLLPSRRPGEPAHIVRKDGDWVCCCRAGAAMHWPIALVIGLELAAEAMDAHDTAPQSAADLGQRLAIRRALSAYAA